MEVQGLLGNKAAFFISTASTTCQKSVLQRKEKEDKVPDWCPRATYESARWSNFWFKRKFLFYAFKYRWSHIGKTLQNKKKASHRQVLHSGSLLQLYISL